MSENSDFAGKGSKITETLIPAIGSREKWLGSVRKYWATPTEENFSKNKLLENHSRAENSLKIAETLIPVIESGQKQYGLGRNGWTNPTVEKVLKKYGRKSPHAPARELDLAEIYHL